MAIAPVTNIGAIGRRRRYVIGGVALAVALALAGGFALGGVPRGARLVLFLPFFLAALGFLQAHGGT
jgi:hypothetical protein